MWRASGLLQELHHPLEPADAKPAEYGGDGSCGGDRGRGIADLFLAEGTELPVSGAVPAPAAVLIRPDEYVAWVADGTDDGPADALTAWFGPPVPPSNRMDA
jgi:hypothetical protein